MLTFDYNFLLSLLSVLKGETCSSNITHDDGDIQELLNLLKKSKYDWLKEPDIPLKIIEAIENVLKNNNVYNLEKLKSQTDLNSELRTLFLEDNKKILFVIIILMIKAKVYKWIGIRFNEYNDGNYTHWEKAFKYCLKDLYRANHLLSRYLKYVNEDNNIDLSRPKNFQIINENKIIYILKLYYYSTVGSIFYKSYSYHKSYDYYCKAVRLIELPDHYPIFKFSKDEKISKSEWDHILSESIGIVLDIFIRKGKLVIEFGRFMESIKWFVTALNHTIDFIELKIVKNSELDGQLSKLKQDELINLINTRLYDDVIDKTKLFTYIVDILTMWISVLKTLPEEDNIRAVKRRICDALIRLTYLSIIFRSETPPKDKMLIQKITDMYKDLRIEIEAIHIRKENSAEEKAENNYYLGQINEYKGLLYINEINMIYYILLKPQSDKSIKNNDWMPLLENWIYNVKNNDLKGFVQSISPENHWWPLLSIKSKSTLYYLKEVYEIIINLNSVEDFDRCFTKGNSYEDLIREVYLDIVLEMDNFERVRDRLNKYLMKQSRLVDKDEKLLPILTVLKRYNSSNPIVPRPESSHLKGGGYFLITPGGKKIIIDPGSDFLLNFYNEGLTMQDIDAVMITHSHLDHMHDFENLLTLLYEYNKKTEKKRYIDLFLNIGSMSKSLPLLSGEIQYVKTVYSLNPLEKYWSAKQHKKQKGKDISSNILFLGDGYNTKLQIIKCKHNDILFPQFSIGLKFTMDFKKDVDSEDMSNVVVGITSDTGYYIGLSESYYDCDLILCHLGDIYREELYYKSDENVVSKIKEDIINHDEDINKYLPNSKSEIIPIKKRLKEDWEYMKVKDRRGLFHNNHLALNGLYTFIDEIISKRIDDKKRIKDKYIVFAVSEFPEELESRRVPLIRLINKYLKRKYKDYENCFYIIPTDIGTRFLFKGKPEDVKGDINGDAPKSKVLIHCDICAIQGKKEEDEYHHPKEMQFTCVKAEGERIESRCVDHTIWTNDKFISFTDYINRKLIT